MRRKFAGSYKMSTLLLIVLLFTDLSFSQHTVFQIAGKKQLFIDDQLVAGASGVEWRVNPPAKAEAVLVPDPETEGKYLSVTAVFEYGG